MFTAVQVAELLGQQVTIQDDQLRRVDVRLIGIRQHPELDLDYMVDVSSGHAFLGSTVTVLEKYVPSDEPDNEDDV